MLNKEQLRKQIIQYFRTVGSGENIVQCIKEALFLHEKFSPLLTFEIISRGKQKITVNDFREYMIRHKIVFNEEQLKYYLWQNGYRSQVTLNQFLQAMIPFNADVVRQFKQKYLESLQIKQFDPQVQFIISELLENQIKLYRSIINIRNDISKIATKKQIEALIKQDLVLQSKPRQARKFHESFQPKGFELGFHQLRKFLEIWLSSKQILHQFYLLNVMRHLKSNRPFQRITCKISRKASKSSSQLISKRANSAKKQIPDLSNQKLRQQIKNDESLRREKNYLNGQSGGQQDKYTNFKNEMMNQYQNQLIQKHNASPNKSESLRKTSNIPLALQRSKYQRQSRGIDSTYLIQILEQIVLKQERLEKLRKNLAKCEDFNLINLTKLIDIRNKGYITSKDFSDYTSVSRVQYNHMVNFYAKDPEKLRFHEFCLIFRPLSKQLNEAMDRRPQHKLPNPFKKQTTKLVLEVINLTADMHQNINGIKQRINSQGLNLKDYFKFIDLQDKGYISATCFQNVLTENNIFSEEKDLKCLMKLFKKKVDQRISLKEFMSFLDF